MAGGRLMRTILHLTHSALCWPININFPTDLNQSLYEDSLCGRRLLCVVQPVNNNCFALPVLPDL